MLAIMVANATFSNKNYFIYTWRSVLSAEETGVPGENPRPVVSEIRSRNVRGDRQWSLPRWRLKICLRSHCYFQNRKCHGQNIRKIKNKIFSYKFSCSHQTFVTSQKYDRSYYRETRSLTDNTHFSVCMTHFSNYVQLVRSASKDWKKTTDNKLILESHVILYVFWLV